MPRKRGDGAGKDEVMPPPDHLPLVVTTMTPLAPRDP